MQETWQTLQNCLNKATPKIMDAQLAYINLYQNLRREWTWKEHLLKVSVPYKTLNPLPLPLFVRPRSWERGWIFFYKTELTFV